MRPLVQLRATEVLVEVGQGGALCVRKEGGEGSDARREEGREGGREGEMVERGKGPPARPSPNSPVCPTLLSPGLLRCAQDDYSSYDELAWFEALCAEHGASSCNTVGKTYQ